MNNPNIRSYKGVAPQIGENCYIDSTSVLVGDIELGANCGVWPLVAMRGDVNCIKIGERSNIQDGSVLHVTHKNPANPNGYPLIIGNDVTVGHKAMLHGCTIGNRVLVGMGAILLDGAVIEDDVMIGAGSLVPPRKVLKSGYLYVGSPVVQKRPLSEAEIAGLQKSADNYVNWKNDYLAGI